MTQPIDHGRYPGWRQEAHEENDLHANQCESQERKAVRVLPRLLTTLREGCVDRKAQMHEVALHRAPVFRFHSVDPTLLHPKPQVSWETN